MKITLDVKVSLLVYKDTSFPFNYGRIRTRGTSRSSAAVVQLTFRLVNKNYRFLKLWVTQIVGLLID